MHSSEHAVAVEDAVVVGFVPAGELAAMNDALAVFVNGSSSSVVLQKNCLLPPAATVKVPAALAHEGAAWSLSVAWVASTGPVSVTVIRQNAVPSSPSSPGVLFLDQGT